MFLELRDKLNLCYCCLQFLIIEIVPLGIIIGLFAGLSE